MLKPEIIKYIEENIDLEPHDLLHDVKKQFGLKCDPREIACICKAVEKTIDLYKKYDQEKVPIEVHNNLMERLKN